jgi:hypothetical protein
VNINRRADTDQDEVAGGVPAKPVYDWRRFGRHALRTAAGALIDAAGTAAPVWVCSAWPDPQAPGSTILWWWHPDLVQGRGWRLPDGLACGDVVGFVAPDDRPDAPPGPWWGIVDSYDGFSRLVLQGPYPTAGHARSDAERLLALDRFEAPLVALPTARHRSSSTRRRCHR